MFLGDYLNKTENSIYKPSYSKGFEGSCRGLLNSRGPKLSKKGPKLSKKRVLKQFRWSTLFDWTLVFLELQMQNAKVFAAVDLAVSQNSEDSSALFEYVSIFRGSTCQTSLWMKDVQRHHLEERLFFSEVNREWQRSVSWRRTKHRVWRLFFFTSWCEIVDILIAI